MGLLLAWARDFFAPLARQSGVTLSLQNNVSGIVLAADRHRLEQVLLNLVLNALRATSAGGWIELAARRSRCQTAVSSKSPTRAREFQPRSCPTSSKPGFSTRVGSPGLGLAVCRKIVRTARRQDYGQIVGIRVTKFTLTFSVIEGYWARGATAMNRVLVVDDDAGMRTALEARFLRRGWQVEIAANAGEALDKFRRGLHPLIVTDIRMPGDDGLSVMRERRRWPRTRR